MEFPDSFLKSRLLKRVAFVAFGALLGFGYYYFVGCRTGACPITSNPWSSTGYGALIGVLLSLEYGGKKGEKETSQKRTTV